MVSFCFRHLRISKHLVVQPFSLALYASKLCKLHTYTAHGMTPDAEYKAFAPYAYAVQSVLPTSQQHEARGENDTFVAETKEGVKGKPQVA